MFPTGVSHPSTTGADIFYVNEAPKHPMHGQKYKGPKSDFYHLCLRWCTEMTKIACLRGSSMYFASPE